MKISEISELATKLLVEYEPLLNVTGSFQTYGIPGNPKMAKETVNRSLESIDEKEMRDLMSRVLDKIRADGKHGLVMSYPDPLLGSLYKVYTVAHGNLNLSFLAMFNPSTLETISHVVCWYYPA